MAHCKVQGHYSVICAKTTEPIQMPFGLSIQVGPKKHVLDGGSDLASKGAILRGEFRQIVKYKDTLQSPARKQSNRS